MINLTRPGYPVQPGDRYRIVHPNGTFTEAFMSKPEVLKIRKISVGSFRRRLHLQERVAIQASLDPVVQVLQADLASSSFVDLDFKEVKDALNYLTMVGILADGRSSEILRDGEQHELV